MVRHNSLIRNKQLGTLGWRPALALALGALLALLAGCRQDAAAPGRAEIVRHAVAGSSVPGIAATVADPTRVEVYAAGDRCLGQPGKLGTGDLMHVGSLGKAMLATTAAITVESGLLRWDSTIGEVLPDLAATGRPEYRDLTVAQLLRHRGGFAPLESADDLSQVPTFSGAPRAQRAAFVQWLLEQPAVATPGTTPVYSNAGYIVVAAMLERSTDRDFEALMQERLLTPLGMHVWFGYPAQAGASEPCGHEPAAGGLERLDLTAPEFAVPSWARPAGHISVSVADYGKFLQFTVAAARGRSTLLSGPAMAELLRVENGFAAGWELLPGGTGTVYWHDGYLVGFYAVVVLDPTHDVAVMAVANAGQGAAEPVVVDTVNRLYQSVMGGP
jgi:CubicO group peptidase (beta-lactamase class C family)